MSKSIFNFSSEISVDRINKIRKLLIDGPKSKAEITRRLDCASATSYAFFKHLKSTDRMHIGAWKQNHNRMTALWAWGPGINEPAPMFVKLPKKRNGKPVVEKPIKQFSRTFVPQPVFRDPSVEMFFGPAYVGLGAELRGMTP